MSSTTGTVLVTGGTSGVGYEAALEIARTCPTYHIIVASRTDPNSAAARINKTVQREKAASYLPLDLSSPANVHAFAQRFESAKHHPIVALVLNAGLQFPAEVSFTPEGIEKTFAINHAGHALLFFLLRPCLAPDARIVLIGSGTHDPAYKSGFPDAHYTTAAELARPDPATATTDGRLRYGNSKLVNIMWSYALARRLATRTTHQQKPSSMTVNAFDPGLMPGTGLAREYSSFLRFLWLHVMPHMVPLLRLLTGQHNIHTAAESGKALARVAVGEEVRGMNGRYLEGTKEIKSSVESYDEAKQEDLWRWTVQYCAGGNEEEARKFEEF